MHDELPSRLPLNATVDTPPDTIVCAPAAGSLPASASIEKYEEDNQSSSPVAYVKDGGWRAYSTVGAGFLFSEF